MRYHITNNSLQYGARNCIELSVGIKLSDGSKAINPTRAGEKPDVANR